MERIPEKLPAHVAIIMDGNGRWAKKRGQDRIEGHIEGAESARKVVESCVKADIPNLTLYAFSTENWSRPEDEVNFLMEQLRRFLVERREELVENGVCLNPIGRTRELPEFVRAELKKTRDATRKGDKLNLYLALNYGGRTELVDVLKKLLVKFDNGELSNDNIDEEMIAENLYAANAPYPDLLIRTGGEMRISNFLLWQLAYTELYFTEVLWPDFGENEFLDALNEYENRERRFGGVEE